MPTLNLFSHLFFYVYFSQQASHKFGPDCLQQAELLKIKQMFWTNRAQQCYGLKSGWLMPAFMNLLLVFPLA